jgi:hypothetical protein
MPPRLVLAGLAAVRHGRLAAGATPARCVRPCPAAHTARTAPDMPNDLRTCALPQAPSTSTRGAAQPRLHASPATPARDTRHATREPRRPSSRAHCPSRRAALALRGQRAAAGGLGALAAGGRGGAAAARLLLRHRVRALPAAGKRLGAQGRAGSRQLHTASLVRACDAAPVHVSRAVPRAPRRCKRCRFALACRDWALLCRTTGGHPGSGRGSRLHHS